MEGEENFIVPSSPNFALRKSKLWIYTLHIPYGVPWKLNPCGDWNECVVVYLVQLDRPSLFIHNMLPKNDLWHPYQPIQGANFTSGGYGYNEFWVCHFSQKKQETVKTVMRPSHLFFIHPFPAISSHFQPLQPFPALSSHVKPFQQFPTI